MANTSRCVKEVAVNFVPAIIPYTPIQIHTMFRKAAHQIGIRSFCGAPRALASQGTVLTMFAATPPAENNIKSETNRLSKTLTKFWEKVDTKYQNGVYEVQLDGKTLKTPLGFPLALPEKKRQLAYLVEHEWANLPDLKVKTNTMPLTSLAARAIDLHTIHSTETRDAELIAKVGDLDDVKVNLLRYLDTDTCLIFTTIEEYEGKLRQRQEELYRPLIAEFESYFGAYARHNGLLPSDEYEFRLQFLDCETDGLRGNEQTITAQNIVLHWMGQIPIYELIALEKAVVTLKSFLCGASLVRSNAAGEVHQLNKTNGDLFFMTIDEIVELGNLETIFQTQEWGEVDDTHDVDSAEWMRSLAAAALVCH